MRKLMWKLGRIFDALLTLVVAVTGILSPTFLLTGRTTAASICCFIGLPATILLGIIIRSGSYMKPW